MRDEDDEIIADLRLRARTERDTTRVGEVPWAPPKIHSRVPCRARCGAVVEWTEDAEERFQIFNRELDRRNEKQLDRTHIVFCLGCREIGGAAAAERNRKLVDAMAEIIRELKAGCEPDRERELFIKLEKAGHPDLNGFRQSLADKASKGKRITRGGL